MSTAHKLDVFQSVIALLRRTGFGRSVNVERINVLRAWIEDGETDVALLADAIVHY